MPTTLVNARVIAPGTVHQLAVAVPPVVHTTGINWVSVITVVSGVFLLMSVVLGIAARYIASRITTSISQLRIEVVDQLDTRLSKVEARLESLDRKRYL